MNTLKAEARGEITVKASKFLGYGYPLGSAADADGHLAAIKKEHPKARHWCYSYRLGAQDYRLSDDGEPSGTAGLPIYQQLLSFDLSNVLLIVVRYFGGTLLGAGGLIKAYKDCSRLTLERAELTPLVLQRQFMASCGYGQMNSLFNYCQRAGATILEQQLEFNCRCRVQVPVDEFPALKALLEGHGVQVAELED